MADPSRAPPNAAAEGECKPLPLLQLLPPGTLGSTLAAAARGGASCCRTSVAALGSSWRCGACRRPFPCSVHGRDQCLRCVVWWPGLHTQMRTPRRRCPSCRRSPMTRTGPWTRPSGWVAQCRSAAQGAAGMPPWPRRDAGGGGPGRAALRAWRGWRWSVLTTTEAVEWLPPRGRDMGWRAVPSGTCTCTALCRPSPLCAVCEP